MADIIKSNLLERTPVAASGLSDETEMYAVLKTDGADGNSGRDRRLSVGTLSEYLFGSGDSRILSQMKNGDEFYIIGDDNPNKTRTKVTMETMIKFISGSNVPDHNIDVDDRIIIHKKPTTSTGIGERVQTTISNLRSYLQHNLNSFKSLNIGYNSSNGSLVNNFKVDESGNISKVKNITANGAFNITGTITASGKITGGSFETNGNIKGATANISGETSVGSLNSSGNVSVGSNKIILNASSGNASISGDLSVDGTISGAINPTGNLSVDGNITASGKITGGSFETNGIIEGRSASIDENVVIGGTLSVNTVDVGENLTVVNNIDANTIRTSGSIVTETGDIKVGSNKIILYASSGNISANGTITASGKITGGSFETPGSGSFGSINSAGNISVNGSKIILYASSGNISANGTITASGKITGGSFETNGDLSVKNISASGTISSVDDLTVGDDILLDSSVGTITSKNIKVFNNAQIDGNILCYNITTYNSTGVIRLGVTEGEQTPGGNRVHNIVVYGNLDVLASRDNKSDGLLHAYKLRVSETAQFLKGLSSKENITTEKKIIADSGFESVLGEGGINDKKVLISAESGIAVFGSSIYITPLSGETTGGTLAVYGSSYFNKQLRSSGGISTKDVNVDFEGYVQTNKIIANSTSDDASEREIVFGLVYGEDEYVTDDGPAIHKFKFAGDVEVNPSSPELADGNLKARNLDITKDLTTKNMSVESSIVVGTSVVASRFRSDDGSVTFGQALTAQGTVQHNFTFIGNVDVSTSSSAQNDGKITAYKMRVTNSIKCDNVLETGTIVGSGSITTTGTITSTNNSIKGLAGAFNSIRCNNEDGTLTIGQPLDQGTSRHDITLYGEISIKPYDSDTHEPGDRDGYLTIDRGILTDGAINAAGCLIGPLEIKGWGGANIPSIEFNGIRMFLTYSQDDDEFILNMENDTRRGAYRIPSNNSDIPPQNN